MNTDGKPINSTGERPRPPVDRRKPGPRKQKDFVQRATALGHSGYGSESLRPHLRDQLRLKELLQPSYTLITYPMKDGKDRDQE